MSVSLRYLGVPPDSGLIDLLLRLAETAPQDALGFQFVPNWLRLTPPGPHGGGWRRDDPAVVWCAAMVARDPEFVNRRADLDTYFDMLHYLLSSARRAGKPSRRHLADEANAAFDDLIAHAFQGGAVLHPALAGTQGIPFQHIPEDIVADLGGCLEALDFAEIRPNFDPVMMAQRRVYRIHPNTAEEYVAQRLSALETIYDEFRTFFVEARRRGESVLAFLG